MGTLPKKAEAWNVETDSGAEMAGMDQALQIVQLNKNKVHELTAVQDHGETSSDHACTCPVKGVNDVNLKQRRRTGRITSN